MLTNFDNVKLKKIQDTNYKTQTYVNVTTTKGILFLLDLSFLVITLLKVNVLMLSFARILDEKVTKNLPLTKTFHKYPLF